MHGEDIPPEIVAFDSPCFHKAPPNSSKRLEFGEPRFHTELNRRYFPAKLTIFSQLVSIHSRLRKNVVSVDEEKGTDAPAEDLGSEASPFQSLFEAYARHGADAG